MLLIPRTKVFLDLYPLNYGIKKNDSQDDRVHRTVVLVEIFFYRTSLLLLLRFPAITLGFISLGEIFAYAAVFFKSNH